jgi:hypothetical protein
LKQFKQFKLKSPEAVSAPSPAGNAPRMPKLSYEPGDPCWIYVGTVGDPKTVDGHNTVLMQGMVQAKMKLARFASELYAIEVVHPDWRICEVRDALLMSDEPTGVNMPVRNVGASS